ncbi:hypothetical protein Q5P01_003047 [Channa striata]|uniref:Cytochrome b5 domain-containing protein 1 n=1 Tax=Channa striata TaxID=64152 RepID=A0AA88NVD0_CHASR|nr:hypothetical protein Q5P01_003047 [Channa striata]
MGRPKYFTPAEVSAHNTADDLWVSFLGKVCDLTPLMSQYKGDALLLPIMDCAGKDISSWFDPETRDVRRYVDPQTKCVRYYTPRGRFVHVPPSGPCSNWDSSIGEPWWRDKRYEVGLLSAKTRWIRVVNTLTSQEQRMEVRFLRHTSPAAVRLMLWSWRPDPVAPPPQVCSEETLNEILQRYLHYNSHARSYTWKHAGANLDMSRTLSENNVPDDDVELERLRLDSDLFTPAILLHFNDDLTEG